MAKVPRDRAAPAKALRIPITNIHDGSAYSAELRIGSAGTVANVLLDTGSSTLVVEAAAYDAAADDAMMITSLAQLITYGVGGWAGPVVTTDVSFGPPASAVVLKAASLAIATVQQGSLGAVTGVMGLAYGGENPAYDFAAWLTSQGMPAVTFPWPFGAPDWASDWDPFAARFQALVEAGAAPHSPLTPYFDQLTAAGLVANRFALYTLRSSVSMRRGSDPASLAGDPLNNGVFVLGGGEEEADLYQGAFVTAEVVHDLFYNLNLNSVRVEGCAAVAAAALPATDQASLISNAILDSGNQSLALADDVRQAVLAGFAKLNPAFAQASLRAGSGQPVAAAALDLAAWPNLYFTFSGPGGAEVELTVAPQTYWQEDSPAAGQASFKITGPISANQSNFGLPLLNNYYTVFDRSQGAEGVVRFAPIRALRP